MRAAVITHRRPPGVVGQAVPTCRPIRRHPPRRHHRHGQPYLRALRKAAAAAAKTGTFRAERSRRLVWSDAAGSSKPWSPSPGLSW